MIQEPKKITLQSGFTFAVISKSALQSSQDFVLELLIHCCKHDWWTNLRLPAQSQGEMRGWLTSDSQWQIRQASRLSDIVASSSSSSLQSLPAD